MAQLNPSFEIDFNDINSYEQIQLINDTQLAKENLLMHRAYKEPSDDEVIRNHFSAFTFVDFCPKVFTAKRRRRSTAKKQSSNQATPETNLSDRLTEKLTNGEGPQSSLRHYELESFSDIFERINVWLKLNRDWQVVSMQTLAFDCQSQFNHLKSSIHANYLPRNSRGLRLYLSPSKSRFAGPQRIGCINVVPRKISGSHEPGTDKPAVYENLDQILKRLNELLLTRPIEGRILSVETITLPIVNGFVNTESNYFLDSRLNLLHQQTYTSASCNSTAQVDGEQAKGSSLSQKRRHVLIDILRVYYEFGPVVCGLVNLIDFVPRFYSPTLTLREQLGLETKQLRQQQQIGSNSCSSQEALERDLAETDPNSEQNSNEQPRQLATESLTRLIRRSLAWFEAERKRVLAGVDIEPEAELANGAEANKSDEEEEEERDTDTLGGVNLKLCNLQVHQKTLLKGQLLKINSSNALQSITTRVMVHEPCGQVNCELRECESLLPSCPHQAELAEPFELRFIRLAYVAPVYSKSQTRAMFGTGAVQYPMQHQPSHPHPSSHNFRQHSPMPIRPTRATNKSGSSRQSPCEELAEDQGRSASRASFRSRITQQSSTSSATNESDSSLDLLATSESAGAGELEGESVSRSLSATSELEASSSSQFIELLDEEDLRQRALHIIATTNERHQNDELAHQLAISEFDDKLHESPIGQLTYRLFAPCQLVKSSSCFSINPVNSSSPLSRRGSVDLNGSGQSCDSASASTLLLPGAVGNHMQAPSASHSSTSVGEAMGQSLKSIGGAIFPLLSPDNLGRLTSSSASSECGNVAVGTGVHLLPQFHLNHQHHQCQHYGPRGALESRFTTNEFESVEAIRRRMEVYVTTNSMKVLAGETLIVNLSGSLSCLSSALEQTLTRASFSLPGRGPSAWVSVYILYAAVDEPQMPSQLLAQQKIRELELISEGQVMPPSPLATSSISASSVSNMHHHQSGHSIAIPSSRSGSQRSLSVGRHESSSMMLYNSAYDRTVTLPTHPENHLSHLHHMDPSEFFDSSSALHLDEADERQQMALAGERSLSLAGRSLRKLKRARRKQKRDEGQCSLI